MLAGNGIRPRIRCPYPLPAIAHDAHPMAAAMANRRGEREIALATLPRDEGSVMLFSI